MDKQQNIEERPGDARPQDQRPGHMSPQVLVTQGTKGGSRRIDPWRSAYLHEKLTDGSKGTRGYPEIDYFEHWQPACKLLLVFSDDEHLQHRPSEAAAQACRASASRGYIGFSGFQEKAAALSLRTSLRS